MTLEKILFWLADASIKAALVLALAIAILGTMKRRSAAARHMVGTLAIGAAVLLPILTVTLPQWRIIVLPDGIFDSSIAHKNPEEINPVKLSASHRLLNVILGGPSYVLGHGNPLSDLRTIASETMISHDGFIEVALAIWITGVGIVIMPWLVGNWAIFKLRRSARPITDIYIASMFHGLLEEYSIRRNVRLLVGRNSMTPVAFGVLRPSVLLPPEALRWPADRLRAALLHELAHVKRWDCATQLLGQMMCAMYWFNPITWLTARQMRVEHERACDDRVLAWGLGEAAYAEHLVVIARSLRAPARSMLATVAMARPSQLRVRLNSILDPSRPRTTFGRRTLLACLALTLAIVTPLAMIHAARRISAQSQSIAQMQLASADLNILLAQSR